MKSPYDHLQRRCPRLGGPVDFSYCRQYAEDARPCRKVFDCWWETFDVVGYMKSSLTTAEFDSLINLRPKPKISSLVELIAQAKERAAG